MARGALDAAVDTAIDLKARLVCSEPGAREAGDVMTLPAVGAVDADPESRVVDALGRGAGQVSRSTQATVGRENVFWRASGWQDSQGISA
jgi:hypothetical protein